MFQQPRARKRAGVGGGIDPLVRPLEVFPPCRFLFALRYAALVACSRPSPMTSRGMLAFVSCDLSWHARVRFLRPLVACSRWSEWLIYIFFTLLSQYVCALWDRPSTTLRGPLMPVERCYPLRPYTPLPVERGYTEPLHRTARSKM